MAFRIEKDTMGEVQVPADKYWQHKPNVLATTSNWPAASMPHEIIEAFGYLKKAAAFANCDLGVLAAEKRDLSQPPVMKSLQGNWMINSHWSFGKLVQVHNQT